MTTLNRRQMLWASGAALLGAGSLQACSPRRPQDGKRILFFTKSSGFQHSVINRQGGGISHAEAILVEVGRRHGFDVVHSKDGRLFEPDQIDQWDAFAFYTTGDLTTPGTDGEPPMSSEGYRAFLQAIANGKGFVGMHCATDTFHSGSEGVSPYIKMIGGEFLSHGAQQVASIEVSDPAFPGAEPFGRSFRLNDEWYAQRNLASDLHVIMIQKTEGMEGRDYQRPDYPMTWARKHGQGRVFYTSMGHREDVWENPKYQGLLIGGLNVVTGRAEADFTPNVEEVTPGYQQLPG